MQALQGGLLAPGEPLRGTRARYRIFPLGRVYRSRVIFGYPAQDVDININTSQNRKLKRRKKIFFK